MGVGGTSESRRMKGVGLDLKKRLRAFEVILGVAGFSNFDLRMYI